MSYNKKSSLHIRKFIPSDATSVSKLIIKALTEVNSKDYPQDIIQNLCDNFSPHNLIEKSQNRLMYIALENDRIVGTISLANKFILSLFVDPTFHRRGIGTELLQYIETIAREMNYQMVNVPSSITAYDFYKRQGYQTVRSEYSPKHGQVIIMEKALKRN
jgi:GNAT superfamily N-acetyltransferase